MVQVISGRCLTRRPGFSYRPFRVGYLMDERALGPVFLRVIQFSPVSITPPISDTHISFICHRRCITLGTDGVCDVFLFPSRCPCVSGIRLRPLNFWDCGFGSHYGHECLSFVFVVCLCDEMITRSEESYHVCVSFCVTQKPQPRGSRFPSWAVEP